MPEGERQPLSDEEWSAALGEVHRLVDNGASKAVAIAAIASRIGRHPSTVAARLRKATSSGEVEVKQPAEPRRSHWAPWPQGEFRAWLTGLVIAELVAALLVGIVLTVVSDRRDASRQALAIRVENLRYLREVASQPNSNFANFSGLDLRGMNLRGLTLDSADFSGALLDNADLQYARLPDVDMTGASLRNANLTCASLDGGLLSDAKFLDADLSLATLSRVTIISTDFSGADMRRASISADDVNDARWPRTRFDGADLTESYINESVRQAVEISPDATYTEGVSEHDPLTCSL